MPRHFHSPSSLALVATAALTLGLPSLRAADTKPASDAKTPEVCAPGTVKPQPESNRKMAQRLAGISREVDPRAVMLFAGKTADYLKNKVAEAKNPMDKTFVQFSYATALLNDGRTEEALQELAVFERLVAEAGIRPKPGDASKILFFKAICYLRLGEQQNCLTNHNGDSCLLPIRGGGIHQDKRGSREAVKLLKQILDTDPTTYAAWLYNIAYMTLGEYPNGVPEQWRLPPEVFASDYDIKRFPDVAGALGVDVDDLSGGVVMDDFDHDGFYDLMVSATSLDSQLRYFRNQGDGTFIELTDAAGLTGLTSGLNLVQGDYNNDGFVDVLVLRGAWLGAGGRYPNSLLRNNGDNTFTDVTEEAGILSFHPTQTAAWFDYDGDGWLDIFIGNESVPNTGEYDPCELYHNNGNGTFTEVAAASGVAYTDWIKAVVTGDYNNDGRPDLYLSSFGGSNYLLRNDGPAEGNVESTRAGGKSGERWKFTNVSVAAGVTEPIKSFPGWFFDYDNDGWLDIFVSGYAFTNAGDVLADYLGADLPPATEHPRLYRNNRDGTFRDVTREMGVYKVLQSMGSNFGDLDNDGWLDFYVGTGDPALGTLIPNRMFRNAEGRGFQDVTTSGGFGQLQKGHGVAFGDVNNDGEQDVYAVIGGAFAGDHYPNQLFANPGHGNHWLKLQLEGVQSNRIALGARIKVIAQTPAGERAIHRVVGSGGSFGCSPLRQEIGLGNASRVTRVEIFWPKTGKTQVISGLALDRAYTIREGDTAAREVVLKSFPWPSPSNAPAHHHHAMLTPSPAGPVAPSPAGPVAPAK